MAAAPVPARLLTLDDVARLAASDDERRYELVDGNLITVPPATARHQRVILNLAMWLAKAFGDKVLLEPGVRTAEDNLNGRIPDLVITTEPVDGDTVWLAPESVSLAVEIVSKGSERTDRWFKPLEYARAGIPRFWRVEPDDVVVQFRLQNGQYIEHAQVALADLIQGDAPAL